MHPTLETLHSLRVWAGWLKALVLLLALFLRLNLYLHVLWAVLYDHITEHVSIVDEERGLDDLRSLDLLYVLPLGCFLVLVVSVFG